jgi:hypothetical protein
MANGLSQTLDSLYPVSSKLCNATIIVQYLGTNFVNKRSA